MKSKLEALIITAYGGPEKTYCHTLVHGHKAIRAFAAAFIERCNKNARQLRDDGYTAGARQLDLCADEMEEFLIELDKEPAKS